MSDFIKEYVLGSKNIFPNVYMASMSGVSDIAFRLLCRRLAKGRVSLAVSEFISVNSAQGNLNPEKMSQLRFSVEENPFCMQFFGYNPQYMALAAKKAEEMGVDFVEINCGCPAPKVVGNGGGSALLRNLDLLREILLSVKDVVSIPVLVKARIGWSEDEINILDTLELVEECGISQLTVHGRHRMQGYRGEADWATIAEVVKHAKIPIIGNGDVRSPSEAISRLQETGCSGIALGRAVMHNPWLLGQIADVWDGKEFTFPDMQEQQDMFDIYHDLLVAEHKSEESVLGKLKQMTARYGNSIVGGKEFRTYILRAPTIPDFFKCLHDYYKQQQENGLDVEYRPDLVQNLNGTKKDEIEVGNDYLGIKRTNCS